MLISRSDVISALNAIGALDSRKEKDEVRPYKINGNTRYALAKNKNKLKKIATEIEEERRALFEKHANGMEELAQGSIGHREFSSDFAKYLKETVDVDIHTVDIKTLHIDENQIDASVIEALLPILTGEL